MVTMQILRMLADTTFYYSFAAFFALRHGDDTVFLAALLQSVCFGLSCLAGRRWWLRLLALLPMAFCWILYPSAAAAIVMAPPALYIVYLVIRAEYPLLRDRQIRLFSVFWKALLVYSIILLLAGNYTEMTQVVLPFAMAMLLCSVLLMRSLRHSPQVYCQLRYQALNLSALAGVVLLACLMSTKAFLQGCATVLKTIYSVIATFLFTLFLNVVTLISRILSQLFQIDLVPPDLQQKEPQQITDFSVESIFGEVESVNTDWLKWLLTALGICALIALLILFFRWLSGKDHAHSAQSPLVQSREAAATESKASKPREQSPVRSVRAQYRRFLKHCTDHGLHLERSSTSLDVDTQARYLSGAGELSGRIREIYLKARYAGKAEKRDAEQMKQLCSQVKKTLP